MACALPKAELCRKMYGQWCIGTSDISSRHCRIPVCRAGHAPLLKTAQSNVSLGFISQPWAVSLLYAKLHK